MVLRSIYMYTVHMYVYMGIYKKPRPFNHIFGGDRILRAWYRGIKNAGPRKRAQGRAQDISYISISPYHHGIWMIFIECGKNPHARKSAQGRSPRRPILPKSNRNFRQPPYIYIIYYIHIVFIYTHIYIYIRWTFIGPIWTPPLAFIVCLRAWFVCLCTV